LQDDAARIFLERVDFLPDGALEQEYPDRGGVRRVEGEAGGQSRHWRDSRVENPSSQCRAIRCQKISFTASCMMRSPALVSGRPNVVPGTSVVVPAGTV
jgi:hypothetical protein